MYSPLPEERKKSYIPRSYVALESSTNKKSERLLTPTCTLTHILYVDDGPIYVTKHNVLHDSYHWNHTKQIYTLPDFKIITIQNFHMLFSRATFEGLCRILIQRAFLIRNRIKSRRNVFSLTGSRQVEVSLK